MMLRMMFFKRRTPGVSRAGYRVGWTPRVSLSVTIPPVDLEPLLKAGFVRLEHLETLEDGGYRVVIERGRVRESEKAQR